MTAISRHAMSVLSVPDKMLTELAIGTDDPEVIASRYGFSAVDFELIESQPSFKKALSSRVAELESKGEIFRVKARYLADDLLADVYADAKETKDARVRLDALKFLSAAGGVATPPNTGNQTQGRQVSISINLGSANPAGATLNFNDFFPEESNSSLDYEGECEEVAE